MVKLIDLFYTFTNVIIIGINKNRNKMVHVKKTKEANAVEKIFCRPMDMVKRVPMTDLQGELMISVLLSEDPMLDEIFQSVIAAGGWYVKAFKPRIEALGYTVDKATEVFVGLGLIKSVGEAVMYSYYLAYKAKESGVTHIRFNQEMCEQWFPMGFPDGQELGKIWKFQKVHGEGRTGSDNLLDYPEASESIRAGQLKEA